MNYRFLSAIPIALYSLWIIYLSSLSSPTIPDFGFTWQDKVIHAGAFFVYGMFLQLFLAKTLRLKFGAKYILLFFLIGCLFGASDEVHQYFVPGRSSEVLDWMADTTGLLLSLVMIFSFSKFRTSSKK